METSPDTGLDLRSHTLTRPEYMRTLAFTLVTDVNERVMGEVAEKVPDIAQEVPFEIHISDSQLQKRRSNLGLMAATNALVKLIPGSPLVATSEYGVTVEDTAVPNNRGMFGKGFGDEDFPWRCAAGIASNVVDRFVYGGDIPVSVARNMSLTDWANIINTGWFSDLVHSLAFAYNGFYGSYGRYIDTYQHNGLLNHIKKRVIKGIGTDITLLETDRHIEPYDGYEYITAKASLPLLRAIRGVVDRGRSAGCPVARHNAMLFPSMLTEDQHTKNLIASGKLAMAKATGTDKDMVRVTQDYSAIDYSLMVLAKQLMAYDVSYGTPRIKRGENDYSLAIVHDRLEPIAEPYLRKKVA